MFVRSYLFSLNQSQLEMYLLDPAVTFHALRSAMNESLPSSVGLLAASHCPRLVRSLRKSDITRDKSIFRDLCRPEDLPFAAYSPYGCLASAPGEYFIDPTDFH